MSSFSLDPRVLIFCGAVYVEIMHIADGYLPPEHAALWYLASTPFVVLGSRRLGQTLLRDSSARLKLGAGGGFAFVLSSLKLPSVAGSSSHPTGMGLTAVLQGPVIGALIALPVLFFQALLLAHGGLTTLGANFFSMGVVGAWVAWLTYHSLSRIRVSPVIAIGIAAVFADLATYFFCSFQLALAHPDMKGGVSVSFLKFLGVFSVTQIPISVVEGILTASAFKMLLRLSPDDFPFPVSKGQPVAR